MNVNNMMLIFQIAIGVYMVYAAMNNKGKVYENKNIIKGREKEYHKMIRLLCAVGGPLSLVSAALGYTKLDILSYIILVVVFAFVVYVIVKIKKLVTPL